MAEEKMSRAILISHMCDRFELQLESFLCVGLGYKEN